jgi:hypothetical protein
VTLSNLASYIIRTPLYEDMPNEASGGEGISGVTPTETFMSSAQLAEAPLHISWGIIHAMPSPNPYVLEHDHPYDEVLFFTGFDPENTLALGGVAEFELGGETQVIDTTCGIYIPAGMKHCPLTIKRVDRPFGLAAVCLSGRYQTMGYETPLEVPSA